MPHVNIAKILAADKSTVESQIGPGYARKRAPGFAFFVKGFDSFWVIGYGKDMTRLACQFGVSCDREEALRCLGLSVRHASIKEMPVGNAPLATRRNVAEITGLSGLPVDPYTHRPWKVDYEEVGVVNQQRKDALRERIVAATGTERIQLIRQCYDWRPLISFVQ